MKATMRILAIGASLALLPLGLLTPAAQAAIPTDRVVPLTRVELREAGFPVEPNTTGWGGTAAVTPSRAGIGEPVTITGRMPPSANSLSTSSRASATS